MPGLASNELGLPASWMSWQEAGRWSFEAATEEELVERGRHRRALGIAIEVRAVDVDEFELVVDGAREPGGMELCWRRKRTTACRRPVRVEREAPRTDRWRVKFDLSHDPAWSHVTSWIGVTPPTPLGGVLVELVGRRFDLVLPTEPTLGVFDLGADVRSARPLAVGETIELPGPEDASTGVELAVGLAARPRVPIDIVIEVVGPDGDERELMKRAMGPGDPESWTAWHDVHVSGDELEPGSSLRVSSSPRKNGRHRTALLIHRPFILAPSSALDGPDVVLVSIDTLRADRMSLYGHDRPTTPRLESWARTSAVVFDHVTAPSPWTLPSHVTLFTGANPVEHGVNYDGRIPTDMATLAERLGAVGYRTAAFTGGGFMRPEYGFFRGFDRFDYLSPAFSKRKPLGSFAVRLERARAWLEGHESERPSFLFLHTYEVHSPYRARQPYFSQFAPDIEPRAGQWFKTQSRESGADDGYRRFDELIERSESGWAFADESRNMALRAAYDSGIAHVDAILGDWLEALASIDRDRDVLVIVTSDHGEALGELGLYSHSNLYDFNLRIPLVIQFPGRQHAGRSVARRTGLEDIVPTVIAQIPADVPFAGPTGGTDLAGLLSSDRRTAEPRAVVSYAASSNGGLALSAANRWKYVVNNSLWDPIRGREELYAIGSAAERHLDVFEANRGVAARMRSEIESRYVAMTRAAKLEIVNGRSSGLEVVLDGPSAHCFRVKTFDEISGATQCRGQSTRIFLQPETEATVFLESPEGDLRVRLRGPGLDRFDFEVDWAVDLSTACSKDGAWTVMAGASRGCEASLTMTSRSEPEATEPATTGDDLQRHLEALGYAN